MKRLTIISHTNHYVTADGMVVGWGATVTEINHLLEIFDHITHIAMLHHTEAPKSALPYTSERIEFVPIPAVGGPKFSDKVAILTKAPKILRTIHKHLKSSDYFQFRAPTGMGVFVIPYLMTFASTKGWFKYAGNWKQPHAPLAYRFQKWLLLHQSRNVTINGAWDDQPAHCISFENPCLTEKELLEGQEYQRRKKLIFPIDVCFVGRLEPLKGVDIIIDALSQLDAIERKKIGTVHLVGDGEKADVYKESIKDIDIRFKFHGFLPRNEVQTIYKKSHAILLPSFSEGFPKVIAEAMNYGCIPIVSDISSIGQYVKEEQNGYLIKDISARGLKEVLINFITIQDEAYEKMKLSNRQVAQLFTYNQYHQHLLQNVL